MEEKRSPRGDTLRAAWSQIDRLANRRGQLGEHARRVNLPADLHPRVIVDRVFVHRFERISHHYDILLDGHAVVAEDAADQVTGISQLRALSRNDRMLPIFAVGSVGA